MSNFFPDKDFSNIKSFIDEYLRLLKNSFDGLEIESIENVLDQLDESISKVRQLLMKWRIFINISIFMNFIKQTAMNSIEPGLLSYKYRFNYCYCK